MSFALTQQKVIINVKGVRTGHHHNFTSVFVVYSQALLKAEDEQDVCAASRAKAEQELELAEFDEGIPLSEDGSGKVSVNKEKKN